MTASNLLPELCPRADTVPSPVIMLTAMGSETPVLRGIRLVANEYIMKPFAPVTAMARVRPLHA